MLIITFYLLHYPYFLLFLFIYEVIDMKNNVINWWNIISKLRYDDSLWDYLEPAEIMEIVQRMKEAKEKIAGLEKYISIDLSPALHKLNF